MSIMERPGVPCARDGKPSQLSGPTTPETVCGLAQYESGPSSTSKAPSSLFISSQSSEIPLGEDATAAGLDGASAAGDHGDDEPLEETAERGVAGAGPASSALPAWPGLRGPAASDPGGEEIAHVDVDFLVQRLSSSSLALTGQVVAYGWEQAALLSCTRRTMPTQLFTALWPATDACMDSLSGQSILDMLGAWCQLQERCPRHFRLSVRVIEALAQTALPAAVKRMRDSEVAMLASLARSLAMQGPSFDPGLSWHGPSSRDLMRPVFALAAAEAAWRDLTPGRWLHSQARAAVLEAAQAWTWREAGGQEDPSLLVLKAATSSALRALRRPTAPLPPRSPP